MDLDEFVKYYAAETNRKLEAIEVKLEMLMDARSTLLGNVRLVSFLTSTVIALAGIALSWYLK